MVAKAKTTSKTTKSTRTTKTTTTSKPKQTKKAAPKRKAAGITDEEVARQAYMLWLERGGSELDNWFEAERQLR